MIVGASCKLSILPLHQRSETWLSSSCSSIRHSLSLHRQDLSTSYVLDRLGTSARPQGAKADTHCQQQTERAHPGTTAQRQWQTYGRRAALYREPFGVYPYGKYLPVALFRGITLHAVKEQVGHYTQHRHHPAKGILARGKEIGAGHKRRKFHLRTEAIPGKGIIHRSSQHSIQGSLQGQVGPVLTVRGCHLDETLVKIIVTIVAVEKGLADIATRLFIS
jgi:hypothetical protein